nr:unnamed protein product [Digitaria exilis]
MELAVGAMGTLAPKLLKLLQDEVVAQMGLKREIESLCRELPMMDAALVDVSKVPPEQLSETDKLWAEHARELSYDMEDAVDAFMVRVDRREPANAANTNIFKKIARKTKDAMKKVKDSHQISDKIKDIKDLSKELAELRAKYTFSGAAHAKTSDVDPRVINLYQSKGRELVGIEKGKEELLWMLTHPEDDKSLKIVSIVGSGGLGTTLSWMTFGKRKYGKQSAAVYRTVTVEVMMGNLVCLEELKLLVEVSVDDFVAVLGKLTRLRKLDIIFHCSLNETSSEAMMQSLNNLQEIRELKLTTRFSYDKVVSTWKSWKPPRQLWSLETNMGLYPQYIDPSRFQRVRYLCLSASQITAVDMRKLALLPELMYLTLDVDGSGRRVIIAAHGFGNLRVCAAKSTKFFFLQGAMPRLESLRFEARPGDDLDFNLAALLSLRDVTLEVHCYDYFRGHVEEAEAVVRH